MSAEKYFIIDGVMSPVGEGEGVNGGAGSKASHSVCRMEFPFAPMYQDARRYNGKCKVWLKQVSFSPNRDSAADFLKQLKIGVDGLFLRIDTPAVNYHHGTDQLRIANANYVYNAGTITQNNATAKCCIPFVLNSGEHYPTLFSNIQSNDYTIIRLPEDTEPSHVGQPFPVMRQIVPHHYSSQYFNTNFDDRNAVIINSPWGQTIDIDIGMIGLSIPNSIKEQWVQGFLRSNNWKSATNGNEYDNDPAIAPSVDASPGFVYFQIVLEPLLNEPSYNGMPNDAKDRIY